MIFFSQTYQIAGITSMYHYTRLLLSQKLSLALGVVPIIPVNGGRGRSIKRNLPKKKKKKEFARQVVVHTFNPSSWEAEAGKSLESPGDGVTGVNFVCLAYYF